LGHKVEQGKPPHYWHHQAQEMKVKRAELIIGKAYYISTEAGWRNKTYRGNKTYFETAKNNKQNKVTIIETQLKTEYDRTYRNRDVFVRYENSGNERWVALNHIRCTWAEAVRLKTEDYRQAYCQDEREQKYRQHLARKVQREQYKPAVRELNALIAGLLGRDNFSSHVDDHRWSHQNWSLEAVQAVNEAIKAGLKTQVEVAS